MAFFQKLQKISNKITLHALYTSLRKKVICFITKKTYTSNVRILLLDVRMLEYLLYKLEELKVMSMLKFLQKLNTHENQKCRHISHSIM